MNRQKVHNLLTEIRMYLLAESAQIPLSTKAQEILKSIERTLNEIEGIPSGTKLSGRWLLCGEISVWATEEGREQIFRGSKWWDFIFDIGNRLSKYIKPSDKSKDNYRIRVFTNDHPQIFTPLADYSKQYEHIQGVGIEDE